MKSQKEITDLACHLKDAAIMSRLSGASYSQNPYHFRLKMFIGDRPVWKESERVLEMSDRPMLGRTA